MNFTFLKDEQIWGDTALDVLKTYGTRVAPTDLAVLLGGKMNQNARTSEDDFACLSWSASSVDDSEEVRCVSWWGHDHWDSPNIREISARPALAPSKQFKIPQNNIRMVGGICTTKFGEYPQTVADEFTSEKLEELHKTNSLRPTGKSYTFDPLGFVNLGPDFEQQERPEYELDGRKYVRVPGCPADSDSVLSTGETVKKRKPYWVQVEPIRWLVDESGWMVSEKCLFAGIPFDIREYYNGDFSQTFIKNFLDKHFAKDIKPLNQEVSRANSQLTPLSPVKVAKGKSGLGIQILRNKRRIHS